MKPTRAQLNLAATIYGAALLALTDGASNKTQFGRQVRHRMSARATEQLARLGLSPNEVLNEDAAMRIAMRLKP